MTKHSAETIEGRRLWWLAVYDPTTGLATRVVGVLGMDGSCRYVSWVPYEPAAELWKAQLATAEGPVAAAVEGWAETSDDITWALIPLEDPPSSPDLAGAVEAAVDDLLAAAAHSWRR